MLSRISIALCTVLTPFAIYNFYTQNYLNASIISLIIILNLIMTGLFLKKNNYDIRIIFWLTIPLVLFIVISKTLANSVDGMLWGYPAMLSVYCFLPGKKAYLLNSVLMLIICPIIWFNIEFSTSIRLIGSLLLLNAFAVILTNAYNEQQKKLKELIATDPLTSLLNRSLLEKTLEQAVEQNERSNIPMALAAFDLDHFKEINDNHGHYIGDKILKDVAEIFINRCRKVDRVFRIGGDEFLVYFYNTNQQQALHIADELKEKIEEIDCLKDEKITVSIGMANLIKGESCQTWLKRSDTKLYEAKNSGKSCIVI